MAKKRLSKKTDQEETEKAYQLLLNTIKSNPQIECSLWTGACWSCLINGYANSGINYIEFCNELDGVKSFYKDHWVES